MPDHLDRLPERQPAEPDGERPQQDDAARRALQDGERAGLVGRGTPGGARLPCQVEGEPGDEQVEQAVAGQADGGHAPQHRAVRRALGRRLPLVPRVGRHAAPHVRSAETGTTRRRAPGGSAVRETGPVASTAAPGILTTSAAPEVARRAWPRWLALGLAMLAVAATGLFWAAQGSRVLLGAAGLFLLARGVVVLRGASGLGAGARGLGGAAVVAGLAGVVAAAVSATLSGSVLLVAVPVLLLGAAGGLLARSGRSRRGGVAALLWALLVTGLLVGSGLAQGWHRATGVATV